jgi:TetR/AcrR family transcriptional regulator, fatty acid metabolism regulator protein
MRSNSELTFTERARREQIVAAALEIVATGGYGQASVAKIADHIGIAKSVVLYHFTTKSDIIEAAVATVMTQAASAIITAVRTEHTAAGKLAAYIRANAAFIAANRTAAVAMLDIVTNYRSADGLRFDQAAVRSAGDDPPTGDLALLDPAAIFANGVGSGEFRALSVTFMKNALRAALDGAVWEVARDPDYDVVGYCEELVTVFELATRTQR